MENQVILSESDIVKTIANSFGVDKKDVDFRHYKETIGYGYSEEEIDRVKVTVTFQMNMGEDKKQEDMIPISTVAEYLAQYAAPPVRSPLAVYGDLVKAWERFFEGLKKSVKESDKWKE